MRALSVGDGRSVVEVESDDPAALLDAGLHGLFALAERNDAAALMPTGYERFWAEPLGFSYLVHRRHPDEMVDLLAGRVYDNAPTPALEQLRMLARKRPVTS